MSDHDQKQASADGFRTGFVAIVGRPNVGKSTLLNRLVGQKVSIVSRKAQTTRHRVTGVLTLDEAQFVFVDTPGFQTKHSSAMNRAMNRSVTQALADVDAVIFVVEAGPLKAEDREVLNLLPTATPVVLVVNKVDRLADKAQLLPLLANLAAERDFAAIVPLSAETGANAPELLKACQPLLPEQPPIFEEDDITDRSERFLASEFIREKLFRLLGEELPYGLAVEIEKFEIDGPVRRIFAAIIVDRSSHKAMVIGKGGLKLKRIASEARVELEKLFSGPVYLEIWVKVKSGWADDERALKSLGFE